MLYMYQKAHVEMKKLLWKNGWKKLILGVH